MLAGLVPANRVLGMHAVGQHDVDDVDFRIVLERVVVLIVVDILRVHAVAQRQLVRLVGMAADQGHHLRLLALRERGQDLVDRQTAQADNRPSQFLARRIGDLLRGGVLQKRSGEIGRCQTLPNFADESAASDFLGE